MGWTEEYKGNFEVLEEFIVVTDKENARFLNEVIGGRFLESNRVSCDGCDVHGS